jgi:hypothetical protein
MEDKNYIDHKLYMNNIDKDLETVIFESTNVDFNHTYDK